jgi:hypothetical protein
MSNVIFKPGDWAYYLRKDRFYPNSPNGLIVYGVVVSVGMVIDAGRELVSYTMDGCDHYSFKTIRETVSNVFASKAELKQSISSNLKNLSE